MVQVNNAALAQLIVLFLPMMRGRGRGHIINVSSIAGGFPSPWAALYSATKSFIDTLTTALYRELRGSGVHVSAVRPGPVRTELYRVVDRLFAGSALAMGRFAIQPEAVAEAIIGLLSRPRRALYVPGRIQGPALDRAGLRVAHRQGVLAPASQAGIPGVRRRGRADGGYRGAASGAGARRARPPQPLRPGHLQHSLGKQHGVEHPLRADAHGGNGHAAGKLQDGQQGIHARKGRRQPEVCRSRAGKQGMLPRRAAPRKAPRPQ